MDLHGVNEIVRKSLIELEEAGDIVIVNPNPESVAKFLVGRLIESWGLEFSEAPPSEVVIENCIVTASDYIKQAFPEIEECSRSIVQEFIDFLAKDRTVVEVADLLSHQGFQEIAIGAYYCNYLKRGKYYGSDYVEWRKAYYKK